MVRKQTGRFDASRQIRATDLPCRAAEKEMRLRRSAACIQALQVDIDNARDAWYSFEEEYYEGVRETLINSAAHLHTSALSSRRRQILDRTSASVQIWTTSFYQRVLNISYTIV